MSRLMTPEDKQILEETLDQLENLKWKVNRLCNVRLNRQDLQILDTIQSAYHLIDLRRYLNESMNSHHDYKHSAQLEIRDLENRNRRLQEQVNTLTGDIEKAKKESGLFIKYVRKMMGGCDGQ